MDFSGALYGLPPDWKHNRECQSREWQNHQAMAVGHLMTCCDVSASLLMWGLKARETHFPDSEYNGNRPSLCISVADDCFDILLSTLAQDTLGSSKIKQRKMFCWWCKYADIMNNLPIRRCMLYSVFCWCIIANINHKISHSHPSIANMIDLSVFLLSSLCIDYK